MLVSTSSNFAFLEDGEPELYELATVAENHVHQSPTTTLRELRTFGEVLAQRISDKRAARVTASTQHDRLVELKERGHLPERIASCLHQIRMRGNDASHENAGTQARAREQLQNAWTAAVWYHEQFHSAGATPTGFTLPPASDSDSDMQSELEQLRSRLETIAGRQAESEEVERLKNRIAELESGSEDPASDSPSTSSAAPRSSVADQARRALHAAWRGVRGAGRRVGNGLRALVHNLRRGLAALGRGARRVVKGVVLLTVVGAFLLYFPSIYATSVGFLPEETRQSLPVADTVAHHHAWVISPQVRSQIESVAVEGIETIRREGTDALHDLNAAVRTYWNELRGDETAN